MSTHITYLSTNDPICQNPERLGKELVRNNLATVEEPPCPECREALMRKNAEEYEKEMREPSFVIIDAPNHDFDAYDPQAAFYGFLLGMLLSSIFWIIFIITFERMF